MCAMMPKRKTAKELIAEQIQRENEANLGSSLRKRLIRVVSASRRYTVMHGLGIFYCGYCGKPVDLWAARPFTANERVPPLYYSCRDSCPNTGFHRAQFIDRMIMELIQRRIVETFPQPAGEGDYEKLLEDFQTLSDLEVQKIKLMTELHYTAYNRELVVEKINALKKRGEEIRANIRAMFSLDRKDNPLFYKLFTTPREELGKLDLEYRRELVKMLINRIRYFNEFLLVKMFPLTEDDLRKSDEMGRTFNINLKVTERKLGTDIDELDLTFDASDIFGDI